MWPGRRYWIVSFLIWLVLTAVLVAYIEWGPFFGRGPLYTTAVGPWFFFWTPLFGFVSFAVGLALKARRGDARTAAEWP